MKKASLILFMIIGIMFVLMVPSVAFGNPTIPNGLGGQYVIQYDNYGTLKAWRSNYPVKVREFDANNWWFDSVLSSTYTDMYVEKWELSNGVWGSYYKYESTVSDRGTKGTLIANYDLYDAQDNLQHPNDDISISYSWDNNGIFNSRGSYTTFRTYAIGLTVNTVGYEQSDLTFKHYLQKSINGQWYNLSLESSTTFLINQGFGGGNTRYLWQFMPYNVGIYRYIVNAYHDGTIVSGGSTSTNIEIQNANGSVTTTTGTAVTINGDIYTPVANRGVEVLSPANSSEFMDSYPLRVGVYGIINGQLVVGGMTESAIMMLTINAQDPTVYDKTTLSLAGKTGDTWLTDTKYLPTSGYGTALVIALGAKGNSTETAYYDFQEMEGELWYHYFDSTTFTFSDSDASENGGSGGRGTGYNWDAYGEVTSQGAIDYSAMTKSVADYVLGFGAFLAMMGTILSFIPPPLLALALFGGTLSVFLILVRR